MITIEQLQSILPQCPKDRLETCHPCLIKALEEFEITTPLRIAAFVAQTAHESGEYRLVRENLSYSADGLVRTWPRRFTKEKAALYARKPEKIASFVYGGRNGNGDEESGDGWRYRGRGFIQVTFRDNYRFCGERLKTDLLSTPELLEQPDFAFRSAGWNWESRERSELADGGEF